MLDKFVAISHVGCTTEAELCEVHRRRYYWKNTKYVVHVEQTIVYMIHPVPWNV